MLVRLFGILWSREQFFTSSYPPNAMSILKVFLWLFAILFGAVVGKVVIHYWLFCSQIQLKLFSKEGHGSWCITFLFTICVLFYQSTVYNAFLTLCGSEWDEYRCSSNLHIEYTTFIKGLAVTTWLGDAFMCWMVFDMMLQVSEWKEKYGATFFYHMFLLIRSRL